MPLPSLLLCLHVSSSLAHMGAHGDAAPEIIFPLAPFLCLMAQTPKERLAQL